MIMFLIKEEEVYRDIIRDSLVVFLGSVWGHIFLSYCIAVITGK